METKSNETVITFFGDCFDPIHDENSEVLVLGSNPPPRSRNAKDPASNETGFYFSDTRNRFWRTMAAVFEEAEPKTFQEKRDFCYRNHVAIWDVFRSCSRVGANDNTIKDVTPNDFKTTFDLSKIKHIFCLGEKAYKGFIKYCQKDVGNIPVTQLWSSSGLACSKSESDLVKEYQAIRNALKK